MQCFPPGATARLCGERARRFACTFAVRLLCFAAYERNGPDPEGGTNQARSGQSAPRVHSLEVWRLMGSRTVLGLRHRPETWRRHLSRGSIVVMGLAWAPPTHHRTPGS